MADRRGGCGLLLVGFVLGFGFAVLIRPEPQPSVAPPPVTSEAPAAELRDRRDQLVAAAPVELAATRRPEPAENATPLDDVAALDAVDVAQLDPQPVQGAPLVSDGNIRRLMIEQSLSSYSGSCPCPYNTDRAGRSCGGRSAYSRPGGASPLCYPSDISDGQVQSFRSRQN